ncbi:hypothetical protein WICPIJ_009163 [Wickerhamomyces pijperi]|uniref:Uncharacterized protein n=1 Tax=Wickerhamomyces pijperi TaxID=599730 RepID=A0A9P8TE48_WICPI|nr:hypothetical protein WICPIJ_009163 [Wickerhamomyces pijperi]
MVKDQFWSLLIQPTRQPVLCLPRLQWIINGWFAGSSAIANALVISESGTLTNGSLLPESPTWKMVMLFSFTNSKFSAGYSSGIKIKMDFNPIV